MKKLQDLLKSFWIETKGDKKLYKVVYGEKGFEFWYLPYVGGKLEKNWELQDESLISKSFLFIKWLVDNDKIDLEILDKQEKILKMNYYGYRNDEEYYTDLLLMLLSISNTPIEDLISVLK